MSEMIHAVLLSLLNKNNELLLAVQTDHLRSIVGLRSIK